jgi:hypothetical protein
MPPSVAPCRPPAWPALCLLCLLAACRTTPAPPPIDLAQPGWRVEHGQAAWRIPSRDANLAGELTAAFHPNGSILLEFTKTPLTLVVVRIDSNSWELNLAGENRTYRGRGEPPPRSAWLVLALALSHRPIPKGWDWTMTGPGQWQLDHPRSGERLEGYLRP